MTNRTDLDKCLAQIELIEQLINQPETFDIDKVLINLETKKRLLMKYMPRDYDTILKGLESGALIPLGDWVKEEMKLKTQEEEVKKKAEEEAKALMVEAQLLAEKARKEAEANALIEKELQLARDKLAELEVLKELAKEDKTEIILE